MPTIHLSFTREPITPPVVPLGPDVGAVASFEGLVRCEEDGRRIAGLVYEAYQPMAEVQLRRVAESLLEEFPCQAVTVIHRLGMVPVGEAAVQVMAASTHRAEAFGWVVAFMDRLKAEVPIWKTGVVEVAPEPIPPPS